MGKRAATAFLSRSANEGISPRPQYRRAATSTDRAWGRQLHCALDPAPLPRDLWARAGSTHGCKASVASRADTPHRRCVHALLPRPIPFPPPPRAPLPRLPSSTTMSSRAEKAAAMRAKILARSKDRMATVTGMPSTPAAESAASEDNASSASSVAAPAPAASSASSSLSAEDAAAALDAALDEVAATPIPKASGASSDLPSTAPVAADPHEFPSALEVAASQTRRDPDADFNAFAQQLMMAQPAPASSEPSAAVRAAARRRAKDAAAASSLDTPLPPAHSPLVLWQARVTALLRSTPPLRMATVLGVVLAGALAGLGYLEGGFGWLILVQLIAQSTAFVIDQLTKSKPTSGLSASAAAAASRPAPSPPPMDTPSPAPPTDDDANIIELDTDAYRSAMGQSNAGAGAGFPGFPAGFPGLGGGAGGAGGLADLKLSAFGLPPAVDTLLSGAMLFFKYAAVMRQVLNDSMIFLFVLVISNAALQLSYSESVVYTQQ